MDVENQERVEQGLSCQWRVPEPKESHGPQEAKFTVSASLLPVPATLSPHVCPLCLFLFFAPFTEQQSGF